MGAMILRNSFMSLLLSLFVLARLAGVLVFYKSLQIGEIDLPEAAILFKPEINCLERCGIKLIETVTSATMFDHQARLAQMSKVLGNCRTRNWKGICDVPRGLFAAAEEVQDSAAGGIGERMESSCRRICNRTVPHNA